VTTLKTLLRLTGIWVLQGFCIAVGAVNFFVLAEWLYRVNLFPIW
jgi:hypothetical protein